MDYDLIGLEVDEARKLLEESNVNFKFVFCTDRKQSEYDKEIVTAVRRVDNELQLVVCRYKFRV